VELNILPTKNKFQLSESTIIESSGKIVVPILLGKTTVEAEVYIVKTEAPFIIGNKLLRQEKIEVSVMEDSMTINKHKINLHPLTSGQLTLWWDFELHKLRNLPEQHQWVQQKLQQQQQHQQLRQQQKQQHQQNGYDNYSRNQGQNQDQTQEQYQNQGQNNFQRNLMNKPAGSRRIQPMKPTAGKTGFDNNSKTTNHGINIDIKNGFEETSPENAIKESITSMKPASKFKRDGYDREPQQNFQNNQQQHWQQNHLYEHQQHKQVDNNEEWFHTHQHEKTLPAQIYQENTAVKTGCDKYSQIFNHEIHTAVKIGFKEKSQENETHTTRRPASDFKRDGFGNTSEKVKRPTTKEEDHTIKQQIRNSSTIPSVMVKPKNPLPTTLPNHILKENLDPGLVPKPLISPKPLMTTDSPRINQGSATPPPSSRINSLTTPFSLQLRGTQDLIITSSIPSTLTEKNFEKHDNVGNPRRTSRVDESKINLGQEIIKKKERIQKKKNQLITGIKQRTAEAKIETEMIQTKKKFQSRVRATSLLTSPDKIKVPVIKGQISDPDLPTNGHMMSSPHKPKAPDQEWKKTEVVNIMNMENMQEKGTHEEIYQEKLTPSKSRRIREHGRPPENITSTTGR